MSKSNGSRSGCTRYKFHFRNQHRAYSWRWYRLGQCGSGRMMCGYEVWTEGVFKGVIRRRDAIPDGKRLIQVVDNEILDSSDPIIRNKAVIARSNTLL